MSASIPVSVPAFTTLQDDVDFVLAQHHTTRDDEIEALATMVGMLGKAQSWGVDFVSAMKNAKAPMCTKVDADTISVSPGVVWVANGAQSFRLPRRNTAAVPVEASSLDTGSMAVGYYYIYAVADSAATTFTVKISASASAPTGLTSFELIGWFYNETAGVLDITSGFIGNVKSNNRDVPNQVKVFGTVADAINDTSYGSDLTEAVARFYSSGRPCLILFNLSGTMSTGLDLDLIVDIDGSDQSDSEVKWGGTQSSVRSGAMIMFPCLMSEGTHTITIQAKVNTNTYNVLAKKLFVVEL